jgi:hypothetical protein
MSQQERDEHSKKQREEFRELVEELLWKGGGDS